MKMRKVSVSPRALVVSALVSITAATTIGVAAPSADAASSHGCHATLCLYSKADFHGKKLSLPAGYVKNLGKNHFDNWTTSLVSKYRGPLCFYSNTNFRGLKFRIGPNEAWSNLSTPNLRWIDNKISSFNGC